MERKISNKLLQLSEDYNKIEKAIKFIETNYISQPELDEIADYLNMSLFHFQKVFSRWIGISPKRYLQFLTKEYAKIIFSDFESIIFAYSLVKN